MEVEMQKTKNNLKEFCQQEEKTLKKKVKEIGKEAETLHQAKVDENYKKLDSLTSEIENWEKEIVTAVKTNLDKKLTRRKEKTASYVEKTVNSVQTRIKEIVEETCKDQLAIFGKKMEEIINTKMEEIMSYQYSTQTANLQLIQSDESEKQTYEILQAENTGLQENTNTPTPETNDKGQTEQHHTTTLANTTADYANNLISSEYFDSSKLQDQDYTEILNVGQ